MNSAEPLRVGWCQGQTLARDDFADESAYHRDRLRRHLAGAHTWGIVRGLDLVIDEDKRLALTAGLAVDGYGRELLLAAPLSIGTQPFVDRDADTLDFWLIWRELAASDEDEAGCSRRFVERPSLFVTLPDPAQRDRRRPPLVRPEDAALGPLAGAAPQEKLWPVYLGEVTCARSKEPPEFSVDPLSRVYAGLVAERIDAPSGEARLVIGRDGADPAQFALYLGPATPQQKPGLSVNQNGAEVAGTLHVDGDVVVEGGALSLLPPVGADPFGSTMPKSPIFRAIKKNAATQIQALRLEVPQGARVEIGSFAEDKQAFVPILTIDTAGKGSVTVEGSLIENGVTKTVDGLSAAAGAAVTGMFLSGLSSVGAVSAGALGQTPSAGVFAGPASTDAIAGALVQALADDDALRMAVTAKIKALEPLRTLVESEISLTQVSGQGAQPSA